MISIILLVAIVWIVAIAGICIMRKLQPDNWIYPVWAVTICILLTIFLRWYISWPR